MAKRKIKDYEDVSLNPENITGQMDFQAIFGRSAKVHIEIGSGKGTFLVSQATKFPEIDFIGIEWVNKYYRHAVDRIGRWGLSNVRIIRTDAADFLAEHVPDSSINCFHIYFPDPWPKKRHHKRRFLCVENLRQMLRCLETGGTINIATDHSGYYEQIVDIINKERDRGTIEIIDFIPTAGAEDGEVAGTNYERKYIKAGKDIYTIAIRKK